MPLRASATEHQSVKSGQIPPSNPNPYEGKYHASAVEIVRKPDRRYEIGLLQPREDRAPLRWIGNSEEHREDLVGGEVVLILAVLIVIEDEGAGVVVEEIIHHRLAHRLRFARRIAPNGRCRPTTAQSIAAASRRRPLRR